MWERRAQRWSNPWQQVGSKAWILTVAGRPYQTTLCKIAKRVRIGKFGHSKAHLATISVAPSTRVRWSAPNMTRCTMKGRSWAALQGTPYYPVDLAANRSDTLRRWRRDRRRRCWQHGKPMSAKPGPDRGDSIVASTNDSLCRRAVSSSGCEMRRSGCPLTIAQPGLRQCCISAFSGQVERSRVDYS
jgi:hypothetical protein